MQAPYNSNLGTRANSDNKNIKIECFQHGFENPEVGSGRRQEQEISPCICEATRFQIM